ncbi:hypothetical protein FDECE_2143 [Fusarium decemcellulare]|nr:hypothetical protein FDECE_2143 [Fusarium decemcellulare]
MEHLDSSNLSAQEPVKKRPAKLFHKKSRTGCQRCRARRVKCDEAKPICSHCTRLELTCIYDRAKSPSDSKRSSPSASNEAEVIADPPESEARRKLELRLFHHFMSEAGPSLAVDDISYNFWVPILTKKALESNSLLYALCMVSALHSALFSENTDEEAADTCRMYLNMAIREHHKDVAEMSRENIDYICLTSSMLRLYGYVRLQERSLQPYTPPIDWLRMLGSSTSVFRRAWDIVDKDPESVAFNMIKTVADYLDDNENEEFRRDLMHLMSREEPHELEESWDDEIEAGYAGALGLIGGIWKSMQKRDPAGSVGRRVIVFPMLVHKRFADLVVEQRPRALVILAHYFALLSMLRSMWWIGDAGSREVRAIVDAVPPEWQGHLSWPKQILDGQIVFG